MVPHLAEACWHALGNDDLVATRAWPETEPALLVEDTVMLPVQVNGKKRGDVIADGVERPMRQPSQRQRLVRKLGRYRSVARP